MLRAPPLKGLKVYFGRGPIVKYFDFFQAGQLFLITYSICDTARQTLYEREVLAPGAGHRGASGLISVQVIRQTGGALQPGMWCSGRRQTECDWERLGGHWRGGIVGVLRSHRCGFVLPGDPRCAEQACQGQITVQGDGCMWELNDRRITTRGQSHER